MKLKSILFLLVVWVPFVVSAQTAVYYIHTDHLGAPTRVTDANQTVVWSTEYEPFGATAPSGSIPMNLRFPGQYHDQETGLYYNDNRYYDPKLGRYITSDPIGLNGGLNTYTYVYNNPLKYIDPIGLDVVVAANGPVYPSNPFGHTAQAFTGKGVYSYGTVHKDGSSFSRYVLDQATRRDSTYYIFRSSPDQDTKMIATYDRLTDLPYDKFANNCSTVTANVVKTGNVNAQLTEFLSSLDQFVPATLSIALQRLTLGANVGQSNITVVSVPRGTTTVPSELQQFDPLP